MLRSSALEQGAWMEKTIVPTKIDASIDIDKHIVSMTKPWDAYSTCSSPERGSFLVNIPTLTYVPSQLPHD